MGRKIQELKTYTNFHPSKSNNKTMNIQFLAYQIKYKKNKNNQYWQEGKKTNSYIASKTYGGQFGNMCQKP